MPCSRTDLGNYAAVRLEEAPSAVADVALTVGGRKGEYSGQGGCGLGLAGASGRPKQRAGLLSCQSDRLPKTFGLQRHETQIFRLDRNFTAVIWRRASWDR